MSLTADEEGLKDECRNNLKNIALQMQELCTNKDTIPSIKKTMQEAELLANDALVEQVILGVKFVEQVDKLLKYTVDFNSNNTMFQFFRRLDLTR